MQLIKTEQSSSFYESFSDLIFCTLVFFILLFLVMAISVDKQVSGDTIDKNVVATLERKLKDAEKTIQEKTELIEEFGGKEISEIQAKMDTKRAEMQSLVEAQRKSAEEANKKLQGRMEHLESAHKLKLDGVRNQMESLVGSNRFTGRNGQTSVSVVINFSDVRNIKYLPYPPDIYEQYSVGSRGETATRKRIREQSATLRLMTHVKNSRQYSSTEMVAMLTALRPCLVEGKQQELAVLSVSLFDYMISGVADLSGNIKDFKAAAAFNKLNPGAELVRLQTTEPAGPVYTIPFQLAKNRKQPLILGGVSLSTDDAVDFISAFGGRGCAVEVRPDVPEWFLDEVLRPTGYINRAPMMTIDHSPADQ